MLAAGGVVWRDGPEGLLVAVAHRPRYDDWSLPKGKLDRGESFEDAAVREVEEEIGVRAELGEELPPVSYHDNKGRAKLVRYWLMEASDEDGFAPNDEVDDVRWLSPDEALGVLTYERDRVLLDHAKEMLR